MCSFDRVWAVSFGAETVLVADLSIDAFLLFGVFPLECLLDLVVTNLVLAASSFPDEGFPSLL
jgi:hypothetical protein